MHGTVTLVMTGDEPLVDGPVVLHYEVISRLSAGEMGQTLLVQHADSEQRSVLRIRHVNSSVALEDLARFRLAAAAAQRLESPGLVPVLRFGITQNRLAFVETPWMAGAALSALLDAVGGRPAPAAFAVVRLVALALQAAHESGVVYGALMPRHVVLDERALIGAIPESAMRVAILPSGISALNLGNVTARQVTTAERAYLSPRCADGGALAARSDVFFLGALLHQLGTGKQLTAHDGPPPSPEDSPDPDAAPEGAATPTLQESLARVARRAAALGPEERFQSVAEFLEALTAAAEVPTEPASSVPLLRPGRASASPAPHSHHAKRRSPRTAALAAGAVLACMVAVFAALVGRSRGDGRPTDTRARVGHAALESPGARSTTAAGEVASTNGGAAPKRALDGGTLRRAGARAEEPASRAPDRDGALARRSPKRRDVVPSRAPPPIVDSAETGNLAQTSGDSTIVTSSAGTANLADSTPATLATAATSAAPLAVDRAVDRAVERAVERASERAAERPTTGTAEAIRAARESMTGRIAAYARAIEATDVEAIRSAYPGMTAKEEAAWREFFKDASAVKATLNVERIDVAGASGEAAVSGEYAYKNRLTGRAERSPVRFTIVFVRDSTGWYARALR